MLLTYVNVIKPTQFEIRKGDTGNDKFGALRIPVKSLSKASK